MTLSFLSKPLTQRIKAKLREFLPQIHEFYGENLVGVLVFGSLVRGDIMTGSDVDLLIILKNSPLSLRRRITEFYENLGDVLDEEYSIFISPFILTAEETSKFHPFYLDILQNHEILLDKEEFIRKFLGNIQKFRAKFVEEFSNGEFVYWRIKNEKIPDRRLS